MFPQAFSDSMENVDVRKLVAVKEFSSMIAKSKQLSQAHERLDRALETLGMQSEEQNKLDDLLDAWLAKKDEKATDE